MEKQKFKLCMTATIKNEAPYIEEWMSYHRVLGVDHFFIFDNNSTDNIDEVMRAYINHGIATLIHWPMIGGQIDAYNYAMRFFGPATEWMAYIDLDEYIVPKVHDSIPELLESLEGADQLLIPWRNYSFSGHETKPAGLVMESYTGAQNIPPDGFPRLNAKAIVRSSVAKRVTAHFSLTKTQATVDEHNNRVPEDYFLSRPTYEKVQLNHYYTKSFEEFQAKMRRGQADNSAEKGMFGFKRPGYDTPDLSALRFLDRVREELALMRSLSPDPFRYGSQVRGGDIMRRDPFTWVAKVAISNYLADTPTLRLATPIDFPSFGKNGDMVARASDFQRVPGLGAFESSIHVKDVVRRLGQDTVFNVVSDFGDNSRSFAGSEDASFSLAGDGFAWTRSAPVGRLVFPTGRDDKSRCYALAFALSVEEPCDLELNLAPAEGTSWTPISKSVNLPEPGYYCGILEMNRDPLRARQASLSLGGMAEQAKVHDLFGIAYG